MKILRYVRFFLRDKVSLLLGIGSLTIGITVSLIIGLWYMNETSYDSFQPQSDNTYRICRKVFLSGESKLIGSEFNPIGKNATKVFPEITEALRVSPNTNEEGQLVKVGNQKFKIKNIDLVDTNFFDFFTCEFLKGNAQAFINKPNSIILDEQTANQLFPDQNPLGKIVNYKGEREVIAVVKRPTNTHLLFHALVPISSVPSVDNGKWGNRDNYLHYIRLAKRTDKAALCKKMKEYATSQFEAYKEFEVSYLLQPLKKIHLDTGYIFESKMGIQTTNPYLLNTFLSVAIIILLISCINFINLFISSAFLRAKAIGLKKMNGAKRISIIGEFISETFFYTSIAIIIALFSSYLLLPYFSQFIGYNLTIQFTEWQFWAILLGSNLFVSVLGGSIPGLYMSGFQALETLKGRFKGKRIIALQKGLVITQFTVSISLLIAVFFVNKQIRFLNNADLGFSTEQLLYVKIPESYVDNIKSIQTELEKSPYIEATCLSNGTPLEWWQGNNISKLDAPDDQIIAEIKKVQHNYFDIYGFKIIEGENTLYESKSTSTECLINERAGKMLGLEKPYVGKIIKVGFAGALSITGVVKDAYTKSLMQKIDPQIYTHFRGAWSGMPLMVKTKGQNIKVVIELLQKQWESYETESPFEYHFLDKDYETLYKSQEQTATFALWTMAIALFLTIAGLWGMARYSSDRRTKEIGVRKINGATILEVLRLLNTEFIKWVLISFVIAVPVAWYATHLWLQNFMLKTALSWWVFASSGLIACFVTIFTVSWQSYRAASKNPVEALRYE